MIEIGLKQHLSAVLDVPIMAMTRGEHLPAVVYNVISDTITQSLSGTDALNVVRVQIDCYHNSYRDAKYLERDVRAALHNHTGDLGGQPCQRIRMENRQDGFENSTNLYRAILRFAIYL